MAAEATAIITSQRRRHPVMQVVKADWAHIARVKRVPRMTALAEPAIILAWRPAAEGAAEARWFRLAGLILIFKLVIWKNDRIVSNRSHVRYYGLVCRYVIANVVFCRAPVRQAYRTLTGH